MYCFAFCHSLAQVSTCANCSGLHRVCLAGDQHIRHSDVVVEPAAGQYAPTGRLSKRNGLEDKN